MRQHIGSDATPCKGVLRYRALTEFSEPIFESFFSYSVQSQESRFVAPLFACFRQPLNVLTMRQLWIEYVLQKTPSLLIQTVPEKNVPVIDLVPSKEVIDLDPPSVTKDKLLPLNWNLLENSLSNLLLELHHQSIAFPEEKSYCRDSIKSAQTQIVNWLQHWKSRSEVERKSTSSTKKRKSRSSNSDSDDEFVESDELNDLDIREYNTKLLILSGRSGISKSCLVHACATICGYTIIEVNSGHERCGANIKKLVAEAAQSQTIKTHDTSSSTSSIEGFNLIFFDEV